MSPPKRASAYVAALKIPVALLCLFGTVLAAYYFFYVTLHRTYLIERNFRLLATLGEQVVASIETDDRVVQNLLRGDSDRGPRLVDWSRPVPRIQPRAANFIPFLKSTAVMGISTHYVLQLVEPESRLTWMRRSDALAGATGG